MHPITSAFIAGGLAACGAVTATHPFETVKIRSVTLCLPFPFQYDRSMKAALTRTCSLQLQGELQAKADAPRLYKGAFHGVAVILKNEGLPGLYRGIGAAV